MGNYLCTDFIKYDQSFLIKNININKNYPFSFSDAPACAEDQRLIYEAAKLQSVQVEIYILSLIRPGEKYFKFFIFFNPS